MPILSPPPHPHHPMSLRCCQDTKEEDLRKQFKGQELPWNLRDGLMWDVVGNVHVGIATPKKNQLLYFELSPPWHLYVLLLANLLAFYLTFYLAFYLAYLLAFYLAYLLAFYLAYLLQYVLAYLLALYLAYLLAYLLTFYLAFYLANLLAFYLTFYLAYLLAFYLAYLLAFYLANILAPYLAYLLAFFLTFYLAFYLAYLLYLAVEVQRCSLSSEGPRLRSSGAHWARRVPGWGPAVLGRSQVEVQRCSLSSESPRLRSSGAQCAQTLAVEVQQCPLRAEVGEELGEELASGSEHGSGCKRWWRRSWRRRTTLIKSNNPHLAGGEKERWIMKYEGLGYPTLTSTHVKNLKASHTAWHMLRLALRTVMEQTPNGCRSTQKTTSNGRGAGALPGIRWLGLHDGPCTYPFFLT